MLKLNTVVNNEVLGVKGYVVKCYPSYGKQFLGCINTHFDGLVVDECKGVKIFVSEPIYSDLGTFNRTLKAAVGAFESSQPVDPENGQYRGFVVKDLFKPVCDGSSVASIAIAIPLLKENGSSIFTTRFESDIKADFEQLFDVVLRHIHNLKPISFSDYINGAENEVIEYEKGSEIDQAKQTQTPPEQVKGTAPVTPVQQAPEQEEPQESEKQPKEETKAQEPTQQQTPAAAMKKQAKDTFACALYYRENHPNIEYGLFDRSKVNIAMGLNGLESLGINSVFKDYDMVLAKAAPDDPDLRKYYFEALTREFYYWQNTEKLKRGTYILQLDLNPVTEDDTIIPALDPGFKLVAAYDSNATMFNPLTGSAMVAGRLFLYEKFEGGKHTIRFTFVTVDVDLI